MRRRKFLKAATATFVGTNAIAGQASADGTEDVEVWVFRCSDTTSYYDVRDHLDTFEQQANNELEANVNAAYLGTLDQSEVQNKRDSDCRRTAFENYLRYETGEDVGKEGVVYGWAIDSRNGWYRSCEYNDDPWGVGDSGTYWDEDEDYSCKSGDSATFWYHANNDNASDTYVDDPHYSCVRVLMHEFGHVVMHYDHAHHNIYDEDYSRDGRYSCMYTGSSDDGCEERSVLDLDPWQFGPTAADVIDSYIQYQKPNEQYDERCQVREYCHPNWGTTW